MFIEKIYFLTRVDTFFECLSKYKRFFHVCTYRLWFTNVYLKISKGKRASNEFLDQKHTFSGYLIITMSSKPTCRLKRNHSVMIWKKARAGVQRQFRRNRSSVESGRWSCWQCFQCKHMIFTRALVVKIYQWA